MTPRILSCDIEKFNLDLERVIAAGNDIDQLIREYSERTEKRYKVRLGCCELYHIFLTTLQHAARYKNWQDLYPVQPKKRRVKWT